MTSIERFQLQFDKCVRRSPTIPPKLLSGIEKMALEPVDPLDAISDEYDFRFGRLAKQKEF